MSDLVKTPLTPQIANLAKNLNLAVGTVLSQNNLEGFEKAYVIANAAGELQKLLTPEYMKPILALQNNRLGFKTDKAGGYPEETVKNCLIEAVLMGVQPFGNQFNIIAGNSYITKEGFIHLLKAVPGLTYEVIHNLPRINADKTSAAVISKVRWKIAPNTEWNERELDIPVKMNQYMGTDAVLGKADRKSRSWLYNTITGSQLPDGDTVDLDSAVVLDSKITKQEKSEAKSEAAAQATKDLFDKPKG